MFAPAESGGSRHVCTSLNALVASFRVSAEPRTRHSRRCALGQFDQNAVKPAHPIRLPTLAIANASHDAGSPCGARRYSAPSRLFEAPQLSFSHHASPVFAISAAPCPSRRPTTPPHYRRSHGWKTKLSPLYVSPHTTRLPTISAVGNVRETKRLIQDGDVRVSEVWTNQHTLPNLWRHFASGVVEPRHACWSQQPLPTQNLFCQCRAVRPCGGLRCP